MSAKFRYWCAKCGYKTLWLDEEQGAEQLGRHYLQRHPGIEPGGDFEIRRGEGRGNGCLGTVVAPFLLLRTPNGQR
ncbi:hypothetical protein FHU38_000756 [Saccharomonospora amisosensis]|uniref:Uncharacterized protein n=1 Tax=Saccharomonospora amisosensis TaxID=1128677 RepID=A0A7X5ULV6_9PSEU|nr:hypothetical protein [Saccharomonospora amisosensis]NIJ10412.1 hypothetical protein [Saccharomonospora amisosensis]